MHRLAFIAATLLPIAALADPATIEEIEIRETGSDWRVSVTLRHGDTGWDDYADGWRIEAPDGRVLGFRELLHPHVNEQPFTRSLGGVVIPEDLSEVRVRARTNTDGWGDETVSVAVPGR